MFILLSIFLFLFTPLAMLILHLVRPRFSIQGFLAFIAVFLGWISLFFARAANPQNITLLIWEPSSFFPESPSLMIDQISWYFSLALLSLALSAVIISIAQLGHSPIATAITKQDPDAEDQSTSEHTIPQAKNLPQELSTTPNWQSWAGMLVLTGLALVAVNAGNLLTLLLAWIALDFIELSILMAQVMESASRERIILAFTARMAGVGLVLFAAIMTWSQGLAWSFETISTSTSIYLILAAGFRLGVLPLFIPFHQALAGRRGLSTILRLVPAASSFILLVRVADIGVSGVAIPYWVILTALVGFYAAINWVKSTDELSGSPYWLLGAASLALAAAILSQPVACLVWSLAIILSGGLVISMSIHHKNLIFIATLGFIGFSALPFSPTWLGTMMYQFPNAHSGSMPQWLFYPATIAFLIIHAFLLAGFIRHAFRGIFSNGTPVEEHIERWVWFLYPLGLISILLTHFFIGFWLYPDFQQVTIPEWVLGFVSVLLSLAIWHISWRYPRIFPRRDITSKTSALNQRMSFEWFYSLFWKLFRLLTRVSALFSTVLEGEGGILWALVLFALIFVFMQR